MATVTMQVATYSLVLTEREAQLLVATLGHYGVHPTDDIYYALEKAGVNQFDLSAKDVTALTDSQPVRDI